MQREIERVETAEEKATDQLSLIEGSLKGMTYHCSLLEKEKGIVEERLKHLQSKKGEEEELR